MYGEMSVGHMKSLLALVLTGFSHVGLADERSEAAANNKPVQVIRADTFRFTKDTRICVGLIADPRTVQTVEQGGEWVLGINNRNIADESFYQILKMFRSNGFNTYFRGNGSVSLVDSFGSEDLTSCQNYSNPILVYNEILPGATSAGYRVRIRASQGKKVFIADIVRPRPRHVFGMIPPPMSQLTDDTGRPIWEVRRDLYALRSKLVNHIISGAVR